MFLLEELYRSFRVADAIDIALVAVFIYAALTWFQETTSRSLLVGVGLLAIVYLSARAIGMHMTVFLFQAVFAVLLIALVVVFQEDLRRAFERLAAWRTVRHRLRPSAEFPEVDTLVECATDLAERKIGALVVLAGAEPLDRHVDGGIPADAEISRPLLDSIFDPHSMGHDGAVIIDRHRIRQFAAHLPLSKNAREIGIRGTRHSAALGLAECTDALCIVVSEERGEVSVAERGRLTTVSAPVDLKNRLVRFVERHYPTQTKTLWTRLLRENAHLKVASLLFACLAWYLLIYSAEEIQHGYSVPVDFQNEPENLVARASPDTVRVTLRGYQRAFNLLEPGKLRCTIDLSRLAPGTHVIEIEPEQISGADELDIDRISPSAITLSLARARPDTLPANTPEP